MNAEVLDPSVAHEFLPIEKFAVSLGDGREGDTIIYAFDTSHVFTGALGGRLRRRNFHEVWERARKKAKISDEVHFHDLRHTGNTLAANAGASTRELMTQMGHSSTRAALIYQHMTAGRDRVIADKLGQMIKEAREDGSPDTDPSGT
ncbi:tyrosine-type recombinase/integrase [Streptacidiphilus jiangxiensis]|uniref:Phage integrase family protein n=1 Tax=Streptacidiphilus jiangxiensis TaxID=235985 RepID=A0A1H7W0Y9_STRJI|nr:Phage integrase family protein [Streptacidiphilus jiangxiensis]